LNYLTMLAFFLSRGKTAGRSAQDAPRQPERDFGNVGDEHQHQEHHAVEQPDPGWETIAIFGR
jgi:hypothetical protein